LGFRGTKQSSVTLKGGEETGASAELGLEIHLALQTVLLIGMVQWPLIFSWIVILNKQCGEGKCVTELTAWKKISF